MLAAINTYTGGGLRPVYDSEGALTDNVNLAAGATYAEGTVLGQIVGSGTAVNEVQTITPTGTVSGGTFILVYDGEYTSALAFNASIATIQAALEALPSIGTGGVTVGGGPQNTTATTYTFAGSGTTAGLHHPLLAVVSSLTGTTPLLTPALTTLGVPANGYWDAYNDSASGSQAGLATAKRILQYAARTDSNGRIYGGTTRGTTDNGVWQRSVPAYFAGTFRTGDGSALVLVGLDANGVTDLGKLIAGTTLTSDKTILRIG